MASKKGDKASPDRLVCRNPKARHDYHLEDKIEAGMVLLGTEVKALRAGKGNIREAYGRIDNGELFLHNMHIGPYDPASHGNHEALRPRKLLLHKRELTRLIGKTREKGITLVPLGVYFKNGRAKVEIALGRGKRDYDRREDVKRREMQREMDQALKRHRR